MKQNTTAPPRPRAPRLLDTPTPPIRETALYFTICASANAPLTRPQSRKRGARAAHPQRIGHSDRSSIQKSSGEAGRLRALDGRPIRRHDAAHGLSISIAVGNDTRVRVHPILRVRRGRRGAGSGSRARSAEASSNALVISVL